MAFTVPPLPFAMDAPEFDSYFWAKARPDLSLSQKIFTVNVA